MSVKRTLERPEGAERSFPALDAELVVFFASLVGVVLGVVAGRFGALETLAFLGMVTSSWAIVGALIAYRRG